MYIEIKEQYWTKAYWLINPSETEQKAYEQSPKWSKRSNFFGVSFIALSLILLCAVMGIAMRAQTNTPVAIVAVSLGALVLTVLFAGIFCSIKSDRWLRNMERDGRALRLSWYNSMGFGDVSGALVRDILFGGERRISLDHMQEALQQIEPHLIDQFLIDPVNVRALTECSNAATQEERAAWRELLEPKLASAISALQPLIDKFQANEVEEEAVAEIESKARVERGLHKVRQFAGQID